MTDLMQKAVDAGARGVCQAHGWNPDAPVEYSGTRRKVKDKDGNLVPQWKLHEVTAMVAKRLGLSAQTVRPVLQAAGIVPKKKTKTR